MLRVRTTIHLKNNNAGVPSVQLGQGKKNMAYVPQRGACFNCATLGHRADACPNDSYCGFHDTIGSHNSAQCRFRPVDSNQGSQAPYRGRGGGRGNRGRGSRGRGYFGNNQGGFEQNRSSNQGFNQGYSQNQGYNQQGWYPRSQPQVSSMQGQNQGPSAPPQAPSPMPQQQNSTPYIPQYAPAPNQQSQQNRSAYYTGSQNNNQNFP